MCALGALREKRTVSALLAVFAVAMLIAAPVLAAYAAPYIITNTSATAYTMLAVSAESLNTWLAANGYMDADAMDTRIETLSGAEQPHMVASDRTLTSVAVPATSQTNLYFTTGNSSLTAMDIITGYGGYFTTPDDATIDPSNPFDFQVKGYLDATSNAVNKNIAEKGGAFRFWLSATNTLKASIDQYTDPTGNVDGGGTWNNEANAYDNNTGTFANEAVAAASWGNYLELTHAAANVHGIHWWASGATADITQIDIDAFYLAAWHDLYQGYFVQGVWNILDMVDVQSVTAVRFRFYNADGGAPHNAQLNEVDFVESQLNTSIAGITTGTYTLETFVDSAKLGISVGASDDYPTLRTSVSLGGVTVPDNTDSWTFLQGNVVPYADWVMLGLGDQFNPDAAPEVTSVDGTVREQLGASLGDTWANMITAAGTVAADAAATNEAVYIQSDDVLDVWRDVARSIALFDTSALPNTITPMSATIELLGTAKSDALGITPIVGLYASNPLSDTALVALDYALESVFTTLQANTITYANWAAADWNLFFLNATGKSAVSLTGISKYGTREVTYDVGGVAPAWGNTLVSRMQYASADSANDPVLTVYYYDATQGLYFAPDDIVDTTSASGTADSGTIVSLTDAALTQADDYWNGARLTVVTTTDGLAPQGETTVIQDFATATDTAFFSMLTAGIDIGDTYTIAFGTLPDRSGGTNDAVLTWGYMPTGVSAALSSMVSDDQPSVAGTTTEVPGDVLPDVGSSDWYGDGSVSGAILSNPIRPFITMVSDNTSLTELLVWRWMGLALLLFATVATAAVLRSHQGITAMIASAILVGLVAFDHNVFPLYLLVLAVGGFVGGLVAERSPAL